MRSQGNQDVREHAWDSLMYLMDVPEDELLSMIDYHGRGLVLAKAVLKSRSQFEKKFHLPWF